MQPISTPKYPLPLNFILGTFNDRHKKSRLMFRAVVQIILLTCMKGLQGLAGCIRLGDSGQACNC